MTQESLIPIIVRVLDEKASSSIQTQAWYVAKKIAEVLKASE